jgi:hypothetical protein
MKRTIRISVLMFGLVGTYVAAAVPQVPALDGGPILTCSPLQLHNTTGKCTNKNLPPMVKL